MAYGFPLFSSTSFPCSVFEPNLDSCHLYTGCPPTLSHNRICLRRLVSLSRRPLQILNNIVVTHDASTVVHYIHLLKTYLIQSA